MALSEYHKLVYKLGIDCPAVLNALDKPTDKEIIVALLEAVSDMENDDG